MKIRNEFKKQAWALGVLAGLIILISLSRCTTLQTMNIPTGASPKPSPVASLSTQIWTLVSQSSCAYYNWKDRGTAPIGYTTGVALSFAKSYCAKRPVMTQALGDPSKDALAWYGYTQPTFTSLYNLVLGLGMRESSGNYSEGYDTTAGPETASEAETGAWQFSYNSMPASSQLQALYSEYQNSPANCLLPVFQTGVTAVNQSTRGTGPGADFQAFSKNCPGFAAEYTATLFRVLRQHFGPINRQEAEVVPACAQMFTQIQTLVDQVGCSL